MKVRFDLGKTGCNMPSSLGSRLIVVRQTGWQADDIANYVLAALHKKIKIH